MNFRHIEGAKIGASGRMETVKGKFIMNATYIGCTVLTGAV